MELTKEYFEKHLDQKFDQFELKMDKKLDQKLALQTKELKQYTDEHIEFLAGITKKGFGHVDSQLVTIIEKLDVRDRLLKYDKKFQKLEDALNIKL